ncbi:hypothetical protein IEE94_07120 [Yimella sp. cx-573]|nr:hypothetical protein [Yimella sp. cx-573]
MKKQTRNIALSVSALAVVAGGAVGVGASQSDAAPGKVNTASSPLTVRSGPGTHYSSVGKLAKGTKVDIKCQTRGPAVKGTYGTSTWWNNIGSGRWVSDAYIYTGSDGRVAPLCDKPKPTSNGMPAAPRTNPHPGQMTRAPKLTARAKFVRAEMQKAFPGIRCDASAYRPGQVSDHNSGNALDCFPGKFGVYASGADLREGNTAAAWLKKYAGKLDVQYVIWQNKIWNIDRASEGWRYQGKSGATYGHYDHLHISVKAPQQH